jgi:steroid 5-alpha reductase family enzyme
LLVATVGQILRAVTIDLDYIVRGGRNRQVYAEKLVTGGMFAHCRNPLYVGNFLVLVGLGLASCSTLFLVIAVPFFAFAYMAITLAEEAYLRRQFGSEFDEYCGRVNRFLPDFSGFSGTLHGMHYNWRRLLTAEYGSIYSWMAAMILVTLQNIWIAGQYSPHNPLVRALWALLAFLTVAYGIARYAKKSGLVQE